MMTHMFSSTTLSLSLVFALAACSEDTTRPRDRDADGGGGEEGDGDRGGDGDPGDGDGDRGSDGDAQSDAELVADVTAKMKECRLYRPSHADDLVEDGYDRCTAHCVLDASCDELRDLTCAEVPDFDGSFYGCIEDCPTAPKDGYACSNGTRIPHVAVCDGEEDCRDGADEEDCEPFVCDDGEEIMPAYVECDGFEDCEDGSDERGCSNVCE